MVTTQQHENLYDRQKRDSSFRNQIKPINALFFGEKGIDWLFNTLFSGKSMTKW